MKTNELFHKGFAEFEFKLRIFSETIDQSDRHLLDSMKQAIIVFAMAEKFQEENNIFLLNNKHDFDNACSRLSEKYINHSDDIKFVSHFMKEHYFNNLIGGNNNG